MAQRRRKKPSGVAARATASPLTPRVLVPYVAGAGTSFCALIAIDRLVPHGVVLTAFQGREPMSPLYAFWMPDAQPAAVLFVLLAIAAATLVPRLVDHRFPDGWFASTLLGLALALPLALFLVRENPDRLGSQFLIYPEEEYFADAHRITDFAGFIRHYAELAPYLSLHGRVHPPGFAAFLFLTGRFAGASPLAAGIAVLVVFAGGVLLAWRAFAQVTDRRHARIAALLLVATPSVLDFACTSMDAVFFSTASLVMLTAFAMTADTGRWWHAAATGCALYVAAFCSFSALPLALYVFAYGATAWVCGNAPGMPRQLGILAGSFLLTYLSVQQATGFDLWDSFQVAREQHYEIMATVLGRNVSSLYIPVTFGNFAALLIGTGLAVVPLLVRGARPRSVTGGRLPHLVATTITLGAMCAGGVYTMETERILMFTMPWLALWASGESLSDSAVRLMVSAGWAQALSMEVLLFTLW